MARTHQITLRTSLLVSLFWLVLFAQGAQTSSSMMAFKKLQSLTGDWESTGEHATTNFKVVVADTTVMETLAAHGMDEMLTVYTVDRDGIALVHYCPTNNQPRMRAVPQSGDVQEADPAVRGRKPHHGRMELAEKWEGQRDPVSLCAQGKVISWSPGRHPLTR
jgi:hypothetical protein